MLNSCARKQNNEEKNIENKSIPQVEIPINIEPTINDVFPLSEVASDLEFVQLEVTDKSLLRDEIHNIQVSDFYILVDDYFSICLYTRNGQFIRKISQKGQGPNEYDFPVCTVLDEENNEIYILTNYNIKVFGINGQYKRSIPNTKSYELFSNLEPTIYKWNKYFFLRDRQPLVMPRQDIWTWALADSSFQIKQKYYNPEVTKRTKELNKQIGNVFGDTKWGEGTRILVDFYNNNFTMSFSQSNAILKFDTTSLDFTPEYRFSFEKKAPFEVATQWGKLDDRIWDYYILYDYTITKDYLYLLLSKGEDGIILRYNKKDGNSDYASFENKIKERKLKITDVVHKSMTIDKMFFRNDISGGCPFRVDYKSENGKYLVDIMNIDEIEQNINIEKLKNEQVKDESSKQRWLDLLNRLSDDEQIIAIATLK